MIKYLYNRIQELSTLVCVTILIIINLLPSSQLILTILLVIVIIFPDYKVIDNIRLGIAKCLS